MRDEYSPMDTKDVSNQLYSADKANRVAKELGYMTVEKMSKMVNEIQQEMLEGDEISLINTGASEDVVLNDEGNIITDGDNPLSTAVDTDDDADNILSTSVDNTNEVEVTDEFDMFDTDETIDVDEIVSDGLNTATDKATSKAKKTSKMLSLATGVVGKTAKVARKTTKAGGKYIRVGKKLMVLDGNNSENAFKTGTNEIKTLTQTTTKHTIIKPINKKINNINRKITQKTTKKAVKAVQKVETKLTEALAKSSSKIANKLIQLIIKVISKIIQGVVKFATTSLPLFIVFIVIVIIIVVCLSVFGGGMTNEELDKYSTYMKDVQSSFQSTTQGYYNDGYKVDGTYNGTAYINWQAALATLQTLQPSLDGSQSELDLLGKMKDDGVMYIIKTETTSEYVRKEEVKDDKGKVITPAVKTTTKYVVTIGTLDDYKSWVNSNTGYIKSFYDVEGISYDATTSTFLTTELSDNIDTLYNSPDFTMLLDEAGVSIVGDIADGTIFDTGENKGILAYPTTSRSISAGYPNYSSGSYHGGVDFPVPSGTPICAAESGTVSTAKSLNYSYGHYIIIDHGKGIQTLYAHNTRLLVSVGQTVQKGQIIAYSGSTGNSTGPHCHFEVRVNGTRVNPMDYL